MNENDGNAEDYFFVCVGGREGREKRCIKHNRMSEKTVAGYILQIPLHVSQCTSAVISN
jgi:hypothetical protein